MNRAMATGLVCGTVAALLGGCTLLSGQRPGGKMESLDMFTFESDPTAAQTVTLVDLRDAQPIWSVDVPVGSKLVLRFYESRSNGTELHPDIMRWTVVDADAGPRPLQNQIAVPNQDARRLDVEFRETPQVSEVR